MRSHYASRSSASRRWAVRACVAVLLLAGGAIHHASAQTATITTREGKEYRGTVLAEEEGSITLIGSDSVTAMVPRSVIQAIAYDDPATAASATHENESYPVIGGALGAPAGFNAVAGYRFGDWEARISGMYVPGHYGSQPESYGSDPGSYGFEMQMLRTIARTGAFAHSVHLGIGITPDRSLPGFGFDFNREDSRRFVTAGYDVNWKGLYLSSGISMTGSENQLLEPMLQLGYLFELR